MVDPVRVTKQIPTREFGCWCNNPKQSAIYLLYTFLPFMLVTTLGEMVVFLFFTWITVNFAVTKFPEILKKYQPEEAATLREFYSYMVYGILTMLIVYTLMSLTVLLFALNGLRNKPSDVHLKVKCIRVVIFILFGLITLSTYFEMQTQEVPVFVNFLIFGLYYYTIIMFLLERAITYIVRRSTPTLLKKTPLNQVKVIINETAQN